MVNNPDLSVADPEISALVSSETQRQDETLRLIASENYTSSAVREAVGSLLCNKYSEGYAGRRYYEGQEHVDEIERIAISRMCDLFGANHANVQSYSGSPANQAIYMALLEPGDTVMGLGLPAGGHLTHGWNVNFSGIQYNAVQYGVSRETERIDHDQVRSLAHEHRPRLIIAGATAYSRFIDWEFFRSVADEVGAYFMADIAHIAGLVAAGVHPTPVGIADVVNFTTHKTLRGPRGAVILWDEDALTKRINKAVFPGLQGGPHNNTTAAIAVAAREAMQLEFRAYARRTVANAARLAQELTERGFRIVTGGTDNHLFLVDTMVQDVPGKSLAKALAKAGIVCNYNSIPFDTRKPFNPSGMRIGTAAIATRCIGPDAMPQVADWIKYVSEHMDDEGILEHVGRLVREFLDDYPAPGLR